MTATATREKPVLFSDPMVRAILDGRKTCTRRLVKHQPTRFGDSAWKYRDVIYCKQSILDALRKDSPWKAGDRLWVRECWADTNGECGPMVSYRAGGDRFLIEDSFPVDYSRYPGGQFTMWCGDLRRGAEGHAWKPSIHMPRWASRINLIVTAVDPVQIQDIDEQEAKEEGVDRYFHMDEIVSPITLPQSSYLRGFEKTWQSLYPGSWDRNDWVYANEFEIEKST